jgi:hypothetical protein
MGTLEGVCVLISEKISELAMYPWPAGDLDYIIVMDDSLAALS